MAAENKLELAGWIVWIVALFILATTPWPVGALVWLVLAPAAAVAVNCALIWRAERRRLRSLEEDSDE